MHAYIKVGLIRVDQFVLLTKIIRFQNSLQVEPVHTIRDKVLSDEICQLIKALLKGGICIAGGIQHLLVVPDLCVDPEEGLLVFAAEGAGEEEKAVVIFDPHFLA